VAPRLMRGIVAAMMLTAVNSGVCASAGQAQRPRGYALTGGNLAHVTHEVDVWERAYQRRDKQTMINKLLAPTTDAGTIEKRFQWLRGYGPHDMPGTVHPPILFDNRKGSFHPTQYALMKTTKIGPNLWDNTVQETGSYHDEDGAYRVTRVRHIKVVKSGSNWYVQDYYLAENPEDYGFYVDDIQDKMTKR
jgi:hypothetical protein